MSRRHLRRVAVALACASAAATATAAPALADETAVGLSTDSPSSLVTFDVKTPGSAQTAAITFPMAATDTDLVGLDYRPRSNQLYAYGRTRDPLRSDSARDGRWRMDRRAGQRRIGRLPGCQ